MTGPEHLQRAFALLNELGLDDPQVHAEFQAAIDAGDLERQDAAVAHGQLGSCYHAIGRQSEAEQFLSRAIALAESPAALAIMHHELGETLFVLEREREAERHYREALRLDRQHPFAPDTLTLLGRAVYFRANSDPALLDESYNYLAESRALWESEDADKYTPFHTEEKAIFDNVFLMGICKSEMPSDNEHFEAVRLFEEAEQIALENREHITDTELKNLGLSWVALLTRMGLERDAQLVAERFARHLS
jgi:tetratricopeptide (TPR) repeat protein